MRLVSERSTAVKSQIARSRFSELPTLETERLILRRILRRDVDDMYEYSRLPLVTQYLLWEPHPNRRHTENYVEYLQTEYRMGKYHEFAVVLKSIDKMIGTCGFVSFDKENNAAEVGYVLNPAFHNCGYATEALHAVLAYGFDTLRLHRVTAKYMLENRRSRRVMEKCGMTYEGDLRDGVLVKGKYETVGICSILSCEFKK